MNKPLLQALFLFITCSCFAQDFFDAEMQNVIQNEANQAQGILNAPYNINTQNYDLKFHRLEFTIDPSVYNIDGIVTTYFEAKEPMTNITFDLTNELTVTSVTKNSTSLNFTQNNDNELVIDLPATLNTGVLDSLTIYYNGAPASGESAFTAGTHSGSPVIYTLSEPYGARDWWPCKQDLNDKIDSIEVAITAPSQYIAVANGIQESEFINGSNKTTVFKHNHPIPAYLIAIACTNYTVYSHTVNGVDNTFPIVNYVYPESLTAAQAATPVTVDIMNLFETLFEAYPYSNEKYGHAQFGYGGGMEHTTISFMGGYSRNLIAHELAHQWFGDKITCGSWQDIWLNEGFATYLSGLVYEHLDGEASFKNWRQARINSITSINSGSVYVPATDTLSVGRVFSSRLSYNKGSMVLHMLRFKLGETAFYQALQNYLSDTTLAFNYAKTPQLITHFENTSGEDLTEFFNDWVYGEGFPSYTIQYNQTEDQLHFTVSQTTSHPSVNFFEMPIPIRITYSNGSTEDIVVNNTTNNQSFSIAITQTVNTIEFDPDYHIVSQNNNVFLNTQLFGNSDATFTIYPNPSSDFINIDFGDSNTIISTTTIYNQIGQQVLVNTQNSIDISNLKTGIYIAKVSTNHGDFHKSFIKK